MFTRSPHRFAIGSHLFLRPVRHAWFKEPFIVTALLTHRGWPHYELLAPDGSVWQASQIELLTTPITTRLGLA